MKLIIITLSLLLATVTLYAQGDNTTYHVRIGASNSFFNAASERQFGEFKHQFYGARVGLEFEVPIVSRPAEWYFLVEPSFQYDRGDFVTSKDYIVKHKINYAKMALGTRRYGFLDNPHLFTSIGGLFSMPIASNMKLHYQSSPNSPIVDLTYSHINVGLFGEIGYQLEHWMFSLRYDGINQSLSYSYDEWKIRYNSLVLLLAYSL